MTAVQVEALVKKAHKVGKFALEQTQAGASNRKKRKKSRHIFYLPARIPRGYAPAMFGGESNFSLPRSVSGAEGIPRRLGRAVVY